MKNTWKIMENEVAKKFGTRRSSSSLQGRMGSTKSDTCHNTLYIECKHRRRISCVSEFRNIERMAKNEHKLPLLVFKCSKLSNYMALCRLKDMKKIAKELKQ